MINECAAMNLRDLEYVVAVAEQRHFGHAADRCHVSQPTLSSQLRKLEDYLGVALFERTSKSVDITPVGEAVLAAARRALDEARQIEEIARAHHDPLAGPLRLGAIPTISPYLMPLILGPLRRDCERMRLILSEETTDTLLARLRNHEIDAAILATRPDDEALSCRPLFEEPFWAAFAADSALSALDRIAVADLVEAGLLLLTDGHCLRDQALALCASVAPGEGGGTANDLRAASLETLIHLVAAGYGATLVPALAIRGPWTTDMGVLTAPIAERAAKRTVCLVSRRSFPRRAALDAVVRVVAANLPNTVRPLAGA